MSLPGRVRVDPLYGCWLWIGRLNDQGYPYLEDGRRAHIAVWEELHGPVPSRRELDHLCRRRACIRDLHMEPVTRSENLRRIGAAYRAALTQCPQGHRYYEHDRKTPEGGQVCRICCHL